MTAQSMPGAGRIPGQMVGMPQGQGTSNGVGGGPAMMRQSTSGGGS
jgi:hypothetical protein